jgi:hypothetical protein
MNFLNFLNPSAFWWSLLLMPLAAFYFLKVRPEKHNTALLFLWDKVFRERQSSALFKRMRDYLSLLLMLLAFCAVILALAQPYFVGRDWQRNFIILIDNSASMGTVDGHSTRLELAKDKAEGIVRNLLPSQRAVIVSVAGSARIRVGVSENQRELLEGIEKIKQSAEPFKVASLEFLKRHKEFFKDSRALLITDGCFAGADNIKALEIVKVGKNADNVGICDFDIVRLGGGNNTAGIFLRCASTFKKTVKVDAVLCRENRDDIVRVIPLEIAPGVNNAQTYKLEDAPAGKWQLYLDFKDALAVDNTACGIIRDCPPVRVGVKSNEYIYSLAISAFSRSRGMMVLAQESPQVEIADSKSGKSYGDSKCKNFIIFKPHGKSVFWKSAKSGSSPAIAKTVIKDHPAIRWSELDTVEFDGMNDVVVPDNALVIVETADGKPLIYKTVYKDKKAYVLNFDPLKADFFLGVNFPVLLCSMVMDLVGRKEALPALYPTGAVLEKGVLTRPGFASINGKEYAVALINARESMVNNPDVKNSAKPFASGIPMSSWLFALALILLLIEEILYNYRKVG